VWCLNETTCEIECTQKHSGIWKVAEKKCLVVEVLDRICSKLNLLVEKGSIFAQDVEFEEGCFQDGETVLYKRA